MNGHLYGTDGTFERWEPDEGGEEEDGGTTPFVVDVVGTVPEPAPDEGEAGEPVPGTPLEPSDLVDSVMEAMEAEEDEE